MVRHRATFGWHPPFGFCAVAMLQAFGCWAGLVSWQHEFSCYLLHHRRIEGLPQMNWMNGLKRLWLVYSLLVSAIVAISFFGGVSAMVQSSVSSSKAPAEIWYVLGDVRDEVQSMVDQGKSEVEIDAFLAGLGLSAVDMRSLGSRFAFQDRPHYRLSKKSGDRYLNGYFPAWFDKARARVLIDKRDPFVWPGTPQEPKSSFPMKELFQLILRSFATWLTWVASPVALVLLARWIWRGFKPAV